jgi:ectoine hydroxylase-related dioxygenase (phytanoyl-CoA dioxygenase family)
VLCSETLTAYAARLMGTDRVRYFRDVLLSMPGSSEDGAATGLHVDKHYWPTCSSERLTTAWFSLGDCGERDGCLVVVSGSHRWRGTSFARKVPLARAGELGRFYGRPPEEVRPVAIPHRRGQVSFHSCRLVHGSAANRNPRMRQSFAVVYQDGSNHFVEPETNRMKRLASFNTNDAVGPVDPSGRPDYANRDFYPLLFGASAPSSLGAAGQGVRS